MLTLFLLALPAPNFVWAVEPIQLADPQAKEQVVVQADKVELGTGLHPGEPNPDCQLSKGARGTVVARRGGQSLISFNPKDWNSGCRKKKGLGDMAMAWVSASKVRSAQSLSLDAFGDTCAAYEYLENTALVEAEVQARGKPCDGDSCLPSPLNETAKILAQIDQQQKGERCVVETDLDRTNLECSFEAIMKNANQCKSRAGKAVKCSREECQRRLREQACKGSPWKNKGLLERYQLTMEMAKTHAAPLGVEAEAIPCIGVVETGYLEPQAKTLLACTDAERNRYHGLGMITQSTLEHYLSPFMKFKTTERPSVPSRELAAFRSKQSKFQRPSFYACPSKLHDALGASPELQVELMAYTLAQKSALVGGDHHATYAAYNANSSIDRENKRPHMTNYADAVVACVSCIKKSKDVGSQIECLSVATRGSKAHPFFMEAGPRIHSVFEGHKKLGCGVEK